MFSLLHTWKYVRRRSDQEFSNLVVPNEYFAGIDLISKIVLNDKRIIDIITKTLVNASKGSYVIESLEFIHKSVCNVLYIPHDLSSGSPPMVINTTETFDDTKFNQIIFAVQRPDNDIIEQSSQHQELPFLREIPCAFWARQCILVSFKDSRLDKSKVGHHPLLDILNATTSNDKVILSNDGLQAK